MWLVLCVFRKLQFGMHRPQGQQKMDRMCSTHLQGSQAWTAEGPREEQAMSNSSNIIINNSNNINRKEVLHPSELSVQKLWAAPEAVILIHRHRGPHSLTREVRTGRRCEVRTGRRCPLGSPPCRGMQANRVMQGAHLTRTHPVSSVIQARETRVAVAMHLARRACPVLVPASRVIDRTEVMEVMLP
jgi:hypothetical protein